MLDKADLEMKHFGTHERLEMEEQLRSNGLDMLPVECLKQSFPYYAPNPPVPIPTPEEIEEERRTANNLTHWRGHNPSKVHRVKSIFAVKFFSKEAENLLYLAEHSEVRVPKVYAAFSHQGADPEGHLDPQNIMNSGVKVRVDLPRYYYLVMEYIPGKDLDEDSWAALSRPTKRNMCRAIAEQLRRLRSVPCSPPYYGRVNHQCREPDFQPLVYANLGRHGPYESYDDFEKAFYDHSLKIGLLLSAGNPTFAGAMELYLSTFHDSMEHATGTEPKLTHMDFHFSNIRFTPKEDKPEDFDVTIIDWQDLCWMPAYIQAESVLSSAGYDYYSFGLVWTGLSRAMEPFPHNTALYIKELLRATSSHTLGLNRTW
ncbi:MAG: hypothetical protein Q9227_007071 [Pyrenula ochraceoflavens]